MRRPGARCAGAARHVRGLLPKSTSEPTAEPPVEPAAEQRPRRLRLPRTCSRTTPGAPAPPHQCFRRPLGCSLLGDGCGTVWAAPRASEPRLDACRSDSNAKGRCCVPARAPRASSIDKERMPTRRRPLPKRDREPSVRRRTTSDGEVSSVGDSKTIGAARSMEPPRRRASRAPHPLVLAP